MQTHFECRNLKAQEQGEDIDFQMNSVEAFIITTHNRAPTITFVDDISDEETECCKNHDEDNFSIEELENAVFSETEDEGKEGCWMGLLDALSIKYKYARHRGCLWPSSGGDPLPLHFHAV